MERHGVGRMAHPPFNMHSEYLVAAVYQEMGNEVSWEEFSPGCAVGK